TQMPVRPLRPLSLPESVEARSMTFAIEKLLSGTTGADVKVFTPATVCAPVSFTTALSFALSARALIVAVDSGLLRSEVLSTAPRFRWLLLSVTLPPASGVTPLTELTEPPPPPLVGGAAQTPSPRRNVLEVG